MKRFDVTVLGELNLDLIPCCWLEALPAERGLLASTLAATLGSSSAISADNLPRLGSRVEVTTEIGRDPWWQIALERLAEAGVDVSKVRKGAGPSRSGLSVTLAHEQSRRVLTYPRTIFDTPPCKEDHV
jgi:sugar/nucleoside kinase (ribokinase family)